MSKILDLITGLPGWARLAMGIGGILVVLVLASTLLVKSVDKVSDKGREMGATAERAVIQETVINNVEKSRDASILIEQQTARGTGLELHAQCLRSAKAPENCKRFLPD